MEKEPVHQQRAPIYEAFDEQALEDPIDRPTRRHKNQLGYWVYIEILIYRGSIVLSEFLDWIAEVERFFDYIEISDDKQAKLVAFKLKEASAVGLVES